MGGSTDWWNWVAICIQGNASTALQGHERLIDLALGASGGETVIIPNIYHRCDTNERFYYFGQGAWLLPSALGPFTNISMRYQSSGNTGGTEDVIVMAGRA